MNEGYIFTLYYDDNPDDVAAKISKVLEDKFDLTIKELEEPAKDGQQRYYIDAKG